MSLSGNLNDEKNHSRKISFEIKCIIEWWSEFSCRLYFTLITFLIIISKNTANESFGCVYYPNIFSVWKKLCSNSIPGKVVILSLLMSECSGDWSDIPISNVHFTVTTCVPQCIFHAKILITPPLNHHFKNRQKTYAPVIPVPPPASK